MAEDGPAISYIVGQPMSVTSLADLDGARTAARNSTHHRTSMSRTGRRLRSS